jgi:hypothetical protein
MREPVYEKGYPSYEAVNRTNKEDWVILLHDMARKQDNPTLREIADYISACIKAEKEYKHYAVQG